METQGESPTPTPQEAQGGFLGFTRYALKGRQMPWRCPGDERRLSGVIETVPFAFPTPPFPGHLGWALVAEYNHIVPLFKNQPSFPLKG